MMRPPLVIHRPRLGTRVCVAGHAGTVTFFGQLEPAGAWAVRVECEDGLVLHAYRRELEPAR